jgi:oligopeptide transport system substrate-binding protein
MRIAVFSLLFILFYSSCTNPRGRNKDKQVFRYNEASAITSLDPAFAKDQANIWACTQLYNGLVQLDGGLHVQPCIAKSWEIFDNGKTYLFHLQSDVLFQPAPIPRLVTAKDFVYSLNRLIDAKVASPGSWVMNTVKRIDNGQLTMDNALSIVALNDSTLEIKLKHSFAPFLSILSMTYCSVVPKEVVEKYGADFREHPCGTGPFKFKMWKEGVKMILLKNENYFEHPSNPPKAEEENRLPYLDAVEISFITDRQSAFIEFLKRNLDFLNSVDASYKDDLLMRNGQLQPKYSGRFKMQATPYLNTEHLDILQDSNLVVMKGSPLNNKLIREALNYGFNRKEMMTYLRNNIGTPGVYGMVPPGLPSFDTAAIGYNFNPTKAISLLKEAGYPDGKGLPEIVLSTDAMYGDLCEYIKTQWEKFGFKIRIDVNQGATHRKMMTEQKLALARASWIADYPDAENYLALFYSKNFTPNGPNYTHYFNKKYDKLYEQATVETNDTVRYRLYGQMDEMLMQDAPVIILYYDQIVRLTQNNIEGLGANAMNLLVLKEVRKN